MYNEATRFGTTAIAALGDAKTFHQGKNYDTNQIQWQVLKSCQVIIMNTVVSIQTATLQKDSSLNQMALS